MRLKTTHEGLHRLRPGELADLLEDLRRDERQELLAALSADEAADALEEMQPDDLEQLLRESDPSRRRACWPPWSPTRRSMRCATCPLAVRGRGAAAHAAHDGAARCASSSATPRTRPGGIMTTALVMAKSDDKVKKVVDRLADARRHDVDLDAVAVVDSEGRLVGDVTAARHPPCHARRHRYPDVRAARATRTWSRCARTRRPSEVAGQLVEARRQSWWSWTTTGAPSGGSWPTTSSTRSCRRRAASTSRACCREGAGLARRWLVYLAAAGPGLIAAAAGNDAGGIVTYSSAGAEFVYRTLFLMVLITVAYVVVQEMVARLAVHTGKGLAALIREEFALAPDRLRHHGVRHRQHRAHGDRVRRDRHRLRALRRVALPLGPHRRRGHLVPGAVRLLPLRRAGLPPLDASSSSPTPSPPCSPTPTGRRWPPTPCGPTSSPRKSFLLLSVALIGTTITPYIQLYEAGAVVDKGVKPEEYRFQRVDAIIGADPGRVRGHVDHRGHRRHHRGDRAR